jgi:hypothetical protein
MSLLCLTSVSGRVAAGASVDPTAWYNIAGILGGVSWLAVYVVALAYGLKKKTCAIPAYAVCLNLGWEIITSFLVPNPVPLWLWVNRGWMLLDFGIAFTLVRYGRSRPLDRALSQHFLAVLAGFFILGFAGQLTYIKSFQDAMGYEVAFLIDLIMAILFIRDFFEAPLYDAGTLAIGVGRLLGDVGVCIQCYFLFPQVDNAPSFAFFHFLFAAVLLLDVLYLALVWRRRSSPA